MENTVFIYDDLVYLGGNDRRLALFESVYPVPRGVSYNSYLLLDEKTVLFDTVDRSVEEQFFENLAYALKGRPLDYLVVNHVEPDHSASFARLVQKYPSVKVVASTKAACMLKNFYGYEGALAVKEGETLCAGRHTLRFVMAPMVHWPEVMVTFDETDGTLFSADAFGTFGAIEGSIFADEVDFEQNFLSEARRYYFNIVGKYGVQVQNVLKKAATLPIKTVCPLHGPVWRKDFAWFLQKYQTWSSYAPEKKGVAIFYASIYGHTAAAAGLLARSLAHAGVQNVAVYDVSVTDKSELVSEAFCYSHAAFLSPTYNNGIFVNMEDFLHDLVAHNYCKRSYAVVENGSWAPQAGTLMQNALSQLKEMKEIGAKVTIISALSKENEEAIKTLAKDLAADLNKNQ